MDFTHCIQRWKIYINELIIKDGYVTIHHKKIQLLAIELFEPAKGFSPPVMNELFEVKEYSGPELRSQQIINWQKPMKIIYYGILLETKEHFPQGI